VIVLQKPVRTGELIDRLAAAIDEAAGLSDTPEYRRLTFAEIEQNCSPQSKVVQERLDPP
jgi:hypothetical protein